MKVNLKNCFVVLNKPQYPENIGASARAIMNMGLGGLIVVNPSDLRIDAVKKMATHEASKIVEEMKIFDHLHDALAGFGYVVGTTARQGRRRRPTHTPRGLGQHLAPISQKNRVALLFGPERCGLSNPELWLCQAVVTIRTADFSSINLAQSVMIIAYELFEAGCTKDVHIPRLASQMELEAMYRHLKEAFLAIGFVNPENPEYWMTNFRRLFARIHLNKKEVRMIRGFCRQLLWRINSLKDEQTG